ncbi:hypothetical protein [Methylorubrum thiocyanatum]
MTRLVRAQIFRIAAAAAMTVGVAGCATTPTAQIDATPVGGARLYAFQSPSAEASAVIVMTRDSGTFGGGCRILVSLDGVKAASLASGETAKFFVPSGERILKAEKDGSGVCWPDPGNFNERETVISKGQTKQFRVAFDLNGRPDIQRSSP